MVYRPARYQPVKSRMISAEPIDAISAPTHAAMSEKRLNRGACERNQGCILHTSSALRMASTPLHTSLSSPKTPPTVKNRMMDTTPSKVIAPTAIANQPMGRDGKLIEIIVPPCETIHLNQPVLTAA